VLLFVLILLKRCRCFREEMTLDRLVAMETFVRVIEAGSFSGAAKLLRVGQPAVSKTIAQLEDRLGVRLLLRSTHGLTPTEAGRNFYERAKRSIEVAEEAELAARGAAAAFTGRLRISSPVTFARLQIVPRLPAFFAKYPDLEVDLVLEDRSVDSIAEGIDVALWMGPFADSALIARKIAVCRRIVVGAPAYFDVMGLPQCPADLLGHQTVIYDQPQGGQTWTFCQGLAEVSVTVNGRLRVSAAEGVREAVFAGLGVSIGGTEWMFTPELMSGAVKIVLEDWSLPPGQLWAVIPAGRQASAKARAFATFMENQLSNS
jgi:DNA-binding transcriptional LysR family regulator